MPKLIDLTPVMATALGVPQPTVGIVARHARGAGLITSKGRGPGGAEMSATDGANLLIGVMSTRVGIPSQDVGDAISLVRSLVLRPSSFDVYLHSRDAGKVRGPLAGLISQLAWKGTFGEALDRLLSWQDQDHSAWKEFMVSIPVTEGQRHFRVSISQGTSISANISFRISEAFAIQFVYEASEGVNAPPHTRDTAGYGDLQTRASIGPNTITSLMNFLQSPLQPPTPADRP
ncbi:MAG: hypothetical protein H7Y60_12450 [Rhodospirillaceae bacterium]|nr:hypothetical protein [Rhodospirillales bacterium]